MVLLTLCTRTRGGWLGNCDFPRYFTILNHPSRHRRCHRGANPSATGRLHPSSGNSAYRERNTRTCPACTIIWRIRGTTSGFWISIKVDPIVVFVFFFSSLFFLLPFSWVCWVKAVKLGYFDGVLFGGQIPYLGIWMLGWDLFGLLAFLPSIVFVFSWRALS
jgi:hypothetical protein